MERWQEMGWEGMISEESQEVVREEKKAKKMGWRREKRDGAREETVAREAKQGKDRFERKKEEEELRSRVLKRKTVQE